MEPKIRLKGFSGEWEKVTIGEISTSFSGGTPSAGVAQYYGGNIPFIRSGEIGEEKTQLFITEEGLNSSSAKMVDKGTLLYALYGATSGEVSISKINGAINQAILAIYPKKGYNSEYLSHYLRAKKESIVGSLLQGGQGNLSGALVKGVEIRIPPTVEEQKAVGEYLDSIDSLIQSTTKKIESLKQVKAASLQSMFPQEGETTPRVRFKGFEGEWEKVRIGDIASIIGGGTPSTSNETYWNGGIPWFTPSEVGHVKYVTQSERTISKEGLESSSAKIIPANSILLSSRATIGEASINTCACTTNQGFQSLIPNNVDLEFLYSIIITKKTDLIRESNGSTFLEISANKVRSIEISIPEIMEQKAIGAFFTNLDSQITLQTQRLEKLKQIKSACLDNMFV